MDPEVAIKPLTSVDDAIMPLTSVEVAIKPSTSVEDAIMSSTSIDVYWVSEDYDGETSWIMYFRGISGSLKFKFAIMYPNEHSVVDWEELAAGKHDLKCYHGTGEGGIQIVDDTLVFGAAPVGGGGDVSLSVAISLADVAGPLRAAIQGAVTAGLPFAAR